MMLKVRIIPNAKEIRLVREADRLKIYLTAPAQEGRANQALIEFLADTFRVKKRQIVIRQGLTSRDKLVEILES
jgi:uncharacterized protein (TIGR00251 family)